MWRKLGGSYREFRRGLTDVQQQFGSGREAKNTFLGDDTQMSSFDEELEDEVRACCSQVQTTSVTLVDSSTPRQSPSAGCSSAC